MTDNVRVKISSKIGRVRLLLCFDLVILQHKDHNTCVCVNTVLSHILHIIRFLQQPNEKDGGTVYFLKLLMKSPRFREVKQGVVEVVHAGGKKKQQQQKTNM